MHVVPSSRAADHSEAAQCNIFNDRIKPTEHVLSSICGTLIIDPPNTIAIPKSFEREYLRHFIVKVSVFNK